MNYIFLSHTLLFRGATPEEVKAMLSCLDAKERRYEKGEIILHCGEITENMGLVLSGSVHIETDDVWGNRTIHGHVDAGQLFAETYACIPGEPLMVNAVSAEKSEILFLNAARLLTTCHNLCPHHATLIRNLLQISSRKNLDLSRRNLYTSPKSIRGRLLLYLSEQAKSFGSPRFTIPFNRQQLADYLSVDRSALSNELSKMQRDGLILYEKNCFTLL